MKLPKIEGPDWPSAAVKLDYLIWRELEHIREGIRQQQQIDALIEGLERTLIEPMPRLED